MDTTAVRLRLLHLYLAHLVCYQRREIKIRNHANDSLGPSESLLRLLEEESQIFDENRISFRHNVFTALQKYSVAHALYYFRDALHAITKQLASEVREWFDRYSFEETIRVIIKGIENN